MDDDALFAAVSLAGGTHGRMTAKDNGNLFVKLNDRGLYRQRDDGNYPNAGWCHPSYGVWHLTNEEAWDYLNCPGKWMRYPTKEPAP